MTAESLKWCATHEKGHCAICGQRRPRSACAKAQADQGIHCPLTVSMDTVVYARMSTNRESSDQTARMRTLIWAYFVRKLYKGLFRVLSIKCIHSLADNVPNSVFYSFGDTHFCLLLLCGFLTLPGTRGILKQQRLLGTCICTALLSWITHAHLVPLSVTKRRPVHFRLNQRHPNNSWAY